MAIIDKNSSNWYLVDQDQDQFIGLSFPLVFDNTASTKKTLAAVKSNLFLLCSTELGERIMQPNLGIRLKRYLFEPFSEILVSDIKETVTESINYWMPFVKINQILVEMSPINTGDFKNTLDLVIEFSLSKDPDTLESIQISVSG